MHHFSTYRQAALVRELPKNRRRTEVSVFRSGSPGAVGRHITLQIGCVGLCGAASTRSAPCPRATPRACLSSKGESHGTLARDCCTLERHSPFHQRGQIRPARHQARLVCDRQPRPSLIWTFFQPRGVRRANHLADERGTGGDVTGRLSDVAPCPDVAPAIDHRLDCSNLP